MLPSFGVSRPDTVCRIVVLPAPLAPISAMTSPSFTSKEIPLMADYQPEEGTVPTNSQVYRVYIERYLCSLPVVNQDLDLIISQKEATMYGVPIQVYFFSRNKIWKEYERIQSDIFDHLLAMVPKFDLKVYQYSD